MLDFPIFDRTHVTSNRQDIVRKTGIFLGLTRNDITCPHEFHFFYFGRGVRVLFQANGAPKRILTQNTRVTCSNPFNRAFLCECHV